jgi:hypothetical protein
MNVRGRIEEGKEYNRGRKGKEMGTSMMGC